MARAISNLFSTSLDPWEKRTFSAVVAYEDSETARHARNVCDYLLEQLGTDCRFVGHMWGFDMLGNPECRELAAKAVASADLVIVSSHGIGDLPGNVKAWIELWLRDKGDLGALVALFDRPQTHAEQYWPIRDYLAGVAERGQLSFFAEPDTWPGKGPHQIPLPLEPFSDDGGPLFLPLQAVASLSSDAQHWGLNE